MGFLTYPCYFFVFYFFIRELCLQATDKQQVEREGDKEVMPAISVFL
jgi:hypothetical protein